MQDRPKLTGVNRLLLAFVNSWKGFKGAFRFEAAFRQELALGVPLLVLAPFIAPGRWQLLLMVASVVMVWIVELLNSGIEAITDRVSLEDHALAKRAKDLGSAAVMLSLACVPAVWLLVLFG